MESYEEEEEVALFLRKEVQEEEDNDDPWDDTKLIQAYDKAISKCKGQIAKKLQNEMGLTNEEIKETFSDVSISSNAKKKRKKKKSKSAAVGSKPPQWQVGDPCRAVYSADGEEYEGVIVEMIDAHWCVVQFVGYMNEEEVLVKELTPSLGRSVIDVQLQLAQAESAVSEVEDTDVLVHNTEPAEGTATRLKKLNKVFTPQAKSQQPQRVPLVHPSTPPPPPVPSFFNSVKPQAWLPTPALYAPRPDAELSTLLQSWYSCGYHTGYYQCLKDMQRSSQRH